MSFETVPESTTWIVLSLSLLLFLLFCWTFKWVLDFNNKFMQNYLEYKEQAKQERLEESNKEELGDSGGSDPHPVRSRFASLKRKKPPSGVNTMGTN